MNEDVLSVLTLYEAEALRGVEPLHCTRFSHCYFLFLPPKRQKSNRKETDLCAGPRRRKAVFLAPSSPYHEPPAAGTRMETKPGNIHRSLWDMPLACPPPPEARSRKR